MDKIKVRSITLGNMEGRTTVIKRYEGKSYASFAEVDRALAELARDAPRAGGYNKTNFKITWADGETYEGRFDLEYGHRIGGPLLETHVIEFLRFIAGLAKPAHITPEQYAEYLRRTDKEAAAREYLEKYDLTA